MDLLLTLLWARTNWFCRMPRGEVGPVSLRVKADVEGSDSRGRVDSFLRLAYGLLRFLFR